MSRSNINNDNQNFLKDVATVKSFGLDSPPSPFHKVSIKNLWF